jgi:hypothetical protein
MVMGGALQVNGIQFAAHFANRLQNQSKIQVFIWFYPRIAIWVRGSWPTIPRQQSGFDR